MLEYESNKGLLIEHAHELPQLAGENIFLDVETTSRDNAKRSTNPWRDCWLLGIAVRVDRGRAYYVPVNHEYGHNIDAAAVQTWLAKTFDRISHAWINHNIKYDVHVLRNAFGLDIKHLWKYCTLDLAKIVDSDRFNYSLDVLSHDWLKNDISQFERAFQPYIRDGKIKDYGVIPSDIMGEYACQDVLTVSDLWQYIQKRMPAESQQEGLNLVLTSGQLIDAFVDMERKGMRINPSKVALSELKALNRMLDIESTLFEKLNYHIQPHVNADCYDVLVNHFGLPVLAWTDGGNPSFDKSALVKYLALPNSPRKILELMIEYRELQTFTSFFTRPYREQHIAGRLHPSYNPTVRTGRSSCKQPNMQQLSKLAKELIEPDEDNVILSVDYSQIEFRLIVHYIKDARAIQAYQEDPDTDFHIWVAEMCVIHRRPAKTTNFLMGYGGGKKRLLEQLMLVVELVGDIQDEVDALEDLDPMQRVALFQRKAYQRAESVYDTYHNTLPGIKTTSRIASRVILDRGYCVNLYGRRRYLPAKANYRAFNTLNQGSAADLMKERLVAAWWWLRTTYPNWSLIGVVHDEVVLEGPRSELCDHLMDSLAFILEDVSVSLRVPIRTSVGWSDQNWLKASDSAQARKFSREKFQKKPALLFTPADYLV